MSPSKMLIPLSYAAILGGTLTLVGTSTNLLVNSIYILEPGMEPMGMFEFTKYGPQHLAGADYKSIMPAYGGTLSDKEIWQVLAYIKAQWPESIRKKHTEAFSD